MTAVIGTAGHIDHGKSSLIHRLTGVHPSRLKEEQERGMTIDIGYAELPISEDAVAGVIDVPGHEKFIRNMVAGSTGVDFVVLVIAADDGVMPQTREHLEIMRLLGIKRGLTALTKIDAVDEEMLELVKEEIEEFLLGTFLDGAPIHAVSNQTGEGIDELREALCAAVAVIPPRGDGGIFRMPVQRAFSVKGHGTVVTGVPTSGSVSVGDELEILPRGDQVRVRGIQVHHVASDRACLGHRTALNVTDVNYREVSRGDVVAARGYFKASSLLEARLLYLEHFDGPLRNATPVRVHIGTSDVAGSVVILDQEVVLPGQTAIVQLRLEEPVVTAAGDRFVLRLASPSITLGGGTVIGETKWRLKRFRNWLNENITSKEQHLEDDVGYLEYLVRSRGREVVTLDEMGLGLKRPVGEVKPLVDELVSKRSLVRLEKARGWIHADMLASARNEASDALLALHDAERLKAGFHAAQIAKASKLPMVVTEAVVEDLLTRGKFESLQGGTVRHAKFTGGLSKEDFRLVTEIEAMHREKLFGSPIRSEIVAAVDKPMKKVRELMTWLVQMGRLVTITPDLAIHAEAIAKAELELVRRLLTGPMESKEFRDLIGTTRKYVIPLLELFDKRGLTVRNDNERVLSDRWRDVVSAETLAAVGEVSEEAEVPPAEPC